MIRDKTCAAFSLIELMVVVAIIGILATIGVPMYQKFSRRARQTYAKSELSGLFTAEKSFQAEYGTYAGYLDGIGFVPEGMSTGSNGVTYSYMLPLKPRTYTIGVFTSDALEDYPCYSLWPQDLPTRGVMNNYQKVYVSVVGYDPLQDPYRNFVLGGTYTQAQICDSGTFVATSLGDLLKDNSGRYDIWTINQSRVLKNEKSGL